MKAPYSLSLISLLFPLFLYAQTPLTAEEQARMIEKIDQTATVTNSIECTFVQTKKMTILNNTMQAQGVMYYRKPDKLRWEYNTPYHYIFVLNGNKAQVKTATNANASQLPQTKMFRQISDVILGCVTGGSLKSNAYFKVQGYRNNDGTLMAKLYPQKKELRQLYQVITLHLNKQQNMVCRIEMQEKTGDTTFMELNDVKVNTDIRDETFSIK